MHVLGIIIHIVKMDDPLLMRLDDLGRQQQAAGNILAYLACHIIALDAVDRRIFIGIFLFDLFIVAFDQAENLVVRSIRPAYQRTRVSISDVALCNLERAVGHNLIFYEILNFLDRHGTVHFRAAFFYRRSNLQDLLRRQFFRIFIGIIGFCNGGNDFRNVKYRFGAVPFNDFHFLTTSHLYIVYRSNL